jgi:hypothetical protein
MESGQCVFWHVVLISFHEEASQAVRQEVCDRYQTLAEECGGKEAGILLFKVEHNLDLRKGVHLVEIAIFRDNDALQAFRVHPTHKELTDVLCQCADWQVGDTILPFPHVALQVTQVTDLDVMYFDPKN